MSDGTSLLEEHLASGATTTCRAWKVVRSDGWSLGFTDHDEDLEFEGTLFKANSGLNAGMVQRTLGLAVDNTEVVGGLTDEAITETDLRAGRFDGAKVVVWLVNWSNPEERSIRFRGTFGEIQIRGGEFTVELRGLSEPLGKARSRVYQPTCPAILGDRECRVSLDSPLFSLETSIKNLGRAGQYLIPSQPGFPEDWFVWGLAKVLSGPASGLVASIRSDREQDGQRSLEMLVDFPQAPDIGDSLLLIAGCDKTARTCREKFNNFINFRGFPHVPGSDWATAFPMTGQRNDGGSRLK